MIYIVWRIHFLYKTAITVLLAAINFIVTDPSLSASHNSSVAAAGLYRVFGDEVGGIGRHCLSRFLTFVRNDSQGKSGIILNALFCTQQKRGFAFLQIPLKAFNQKTLLVFLDPHIIE